MSSRGTRAVWIWRDSDGVERFAGYGAFGDIHPAVLRWQARHKDDSELGLWLQTLDEEPDRENYGPRVMGVVSALEAVLGLRKRYEATLLKTRGLSTYRGGHPSRVVYFLDDEDDDVRYFNSVREASRAVGRNASTVTRWCNDPRRMNWGYLDEID